MLAATPALEVVGTASDGALAVALALELQPDVVLMDLHMPRVNGIDATAQIVRSSPHIGVLVLTMMEDEESVFAAVRAGARGYLLKGARRGEITAGCTGCRSRRGDLRSGDRGSGDVLLSRVRAPPHPATPFPTSPTASGWCWG